MKILAVMPVEVVVWEDSDIKFREKLSDDPMVNVTQGWLVRETKKLVILMHEATHIPTFLNDSMDYTRILKRNILHRHHVGDAPVFFELPVSHGSRRKKTAEPVGATIKGGAETLEVTSAVHRGSPPRDPASSPSS